MKYIFECSIASVQIKSESEKIKKKHSSMELSTPFVAEEPLKKKKEYDLMKIGCKIHYLKIDYNHQLMEFECFARSALRSCVVGDLY